MESAEMDVLTDVLQTVRVSSVCYGRVELGAPWGLKVGASESAAFHVLLRGSCWLEVEGMGEPVSLTSVDLFALPHGKAHILRDSLETPARPLQELIPCGEPSEPGCGGARGMGKTIRVGGQGASSTLVCGAFKFE